MCLAINTDNTNRFKNRYKNTPKTKIKIQKLVRIDLDGVCSPFYNTDIEGGWLKPAKTFYDSKYVEGGAIHCYSIKYKALPEHNQAILNCWAYAEDFIGQNASEHMAFKKIWVPIEEIERVIKNYKRRNK